MYYLMLENTEPVDEEDETPPVMYTYEPDPLPSGFVRQWMTGQPFAQQPPTPVRVTIAPGDAGRMGEYYGSQIWLMSKRLRDFFTAAGVDNIDYYPAEIVDVESGNSYDNFFAFNVVGLISAADLGKSRYSDIDGLKMFDSISVDAGKAKGALLFRMAESPSQILVHESIKLKAEREKISDLRFLEPDNLA